MRKGIKWLFIFGVLVSLAFTGIKFAVSNSAARQLGIAESEDIQQRIDQIEEELASIPKSRFVEVPWTFGYRSGNYKKQQTIVIEITFPEPRLIDLVVLMPCSYIGENNRVRSVGFPRHFLIEQIDKEGNSLEIADYSNKEYPDLDFAPQLFVCSSTVESKALRITATELGDNFEVVADSHVLALSEILAFSGAKNVALGAEVNINVENVSNDLWHEKALVDGHLPFQPVQQKYYRRQHQYLTQQDPVELNFDLGSEQSIDEFRIWPNSYFLQNTFPDLQGEGFPTRIQFAKVEKSHEDETVQIIYTSDPLALKPGTGPLLKSFKPVRGRFFRFTMAGAFLDTAGSGTSPAGIKLSEIELLHEGELISRDIPPQQQEKLSRVSSYSLNDTQVLTDGKVTMGDVMPLREWLVQFSKRASLEQVLGEQRLQLTLAIQRDKNRFVILVLVLVTFTLLTLMLIWILRLRHLSSMTEMRERIACDIHDEIGANLSSIAHSFDLLKRTIPEPSEIQATLLSDSGKTIRSTAEEARKIVQLLEDRAQHVSLLSEFKATTQELLITIPYHFEADESLALNRLSPMEQWHLLLFYKEALNNILKHSKANLVNIQLGKSEKSRVLSICDNGTGIPAERLPLQHLESRAQRLKGTMRIETKLGKGTTIELKF